MSVVPKPEIGCQPARGLLQEQAGVDHPAARAAVRLGDADPEPAELGELRVELVGVLVGAAAVSRSRCSRVPHSRAQKSRRAPTKSCCSSVWVTVMAEGSWLGRTKGELVSAYTDAGAETARGDLRVACGLVRTIGEVDRAQRGVAAPAPHGAGRGPAG
jgi:hypothetical protein